MKKISYGQLLTDYGMETSVDDMFYRASDVDALFDDVRRLVDVAKVAKDNLSFYDSNAADRLYLNLKKAIAAVEAMMEEVPSGIKS